jgi:hypothetical protein
MAKQDVKQLLAKTGQRRVAEVTLTTGDVFSFWFQPLTEADDAKIREAIQGDTRSNAYGYRVLISKAEHEDGEKMFANSDIPMMRQSYSQVDMMRIMSALVDNNGILASEDSKSD